MIRQTGQQIITVNRLSDISKSKSNFDNEIWSVSKKIHEKDFSRKNHT